MKAFIFALALLLALPAAAHAEPATKDEQRKEILRIEADTLAELYKADPATQAELAGASGYAVFTSADLAALFVSGSYGHGVARSSLTNDQTYMQMASLGVGLGLGIKDFRVVFVFSTAEAYKEFVTTGLDLSGNADIAITDGVKGGAVTGVQGVLNGVKVYQLTEKGLMAQFMLKGSKYWRDDTLNAVDNAK